MTSFVLTTPVAFLVFNRPDTTARVFAAIREARPAQLLVVADGPRAGRAGEADLCAKVRRIVEQVDWPCTVQHNYAESNMGCRQRVASGLDWVFQQVEEAIILEDDCLPDPTFFRFCQELLQYHCGDRRIGMISGDNFQFGAPCGDDSYYFSRNFHIWGWATWRDRWSGCYDVSMAKWPEAKKRRWLSGMLEERGERAEWEKNFQRAYSGRINTWDYQWVFANWMENRLCILPTVNLVSNIGFGSDATHVVAGSYLADIERRPFAFPLRHPREISRNRDADRRSRHSCSIPLWKYLINRLLRRQG
jgi:hypothetical protein